MALRAQRITGFLICATVVGLMACGGSGGGGGGSNGGNGASTNTPVRGATSTATPPGQGTPGQGTSTPTPEATATVAAAFVVHPGESIVEKAKSAPAGSVIFVAAGSYGPVTFNPGDLQDAITLAADLTGGQTESPAGPITIDARGQAFAFSVSGNNDLTIDGFTIRGATKAGVQAVNSPGFVVRGCDIKLNTHLNTSDPGDGVVLDGSNDALVFDNVIWRNSGAGIRIFGSSDVRVINNTVYKNTDHGIFVGDALEPSVNTVLRNNIFNGNMPKGIVVDASTSGFDGDFDLNTDGYGADTPVGPNDIDADPLFTEPGTDDGFRLQTELIGSNSPAIDAGAPNLDGDLVDQLSRRSTQADGSEDVPPIDLGFHYLPASAFATPTPTPRAPRATPTRTRAVTAGPSGTPTATRRPGTQGPTHTPTPTATTRGPQHSPTRTPG